MVLNKRGQGIFFLFMISIVMFILGFSLTPVLVTNASSVMSNMNCSNASITTDFKVTCQVIDLSSALVGGIIFALGGLALGAKIMYG
jgi:hypothetical protein